VIGQHFATFHTDFILHPGLPSLVLHRPASLIDIALLRRGRGIFDHPFVADQFGTLVHAVPRSMMAQRLPNNFDIIDKSRSQVTTGVTTVTKSAHL
jgi:hypothetical protein